MSRLSPTNGHLSRGRMTAYSGRKGTPHLLLPIRRSKALGCGANGHNMFHSGGTALRRAELGIARVLDVVFEVGPAGRLVRKAANDQDKSVDHVGLASDTIRALAENLNTPFLLPISSTVRSLLEIIPRQTVRHYKSECVQLMNKTIDILYLVIALHFKTDFPGELPPNVLEPLGEFTRILHKILTFVESQQGGGRGSYLLRHFETTILLRECKLGLKMAIDELKIRPARLVHDIERMREHAEETHRQVMDLVSALSDDDSSDTTSTRSTKFSLYSSCSSSTSISLLPPTPKIFHGREREMQDVLDQFNNRAPRMTVLGPAGIGKTTVARSILHHSDIVQRYDQRRYFVTCDTASTVEELITLIGAHLELKPSRQLKRQVLRLLSVQPTLLILDNFETVWEPRGCRKQVEDFLSLLADCEKLALVITMRGAERPVGVNWTHPFLPPLLPLSQDAARRTFVDITDMTFDLNDNHSEIDTVLELTGNMPLAIDLLAHLVDCSSGGCAQVLTQWETERTAMLSDGHNTRSSLDMSISVSLASPRLTESTPDAIKLLSLLSLLPDGLSDVELAQCKLPITDLGNCRTALLRTSLAYLTAQKRIKVLVPIREYMQRYHPPHIPLVEPIFQHYHDVLNLFRKHMGTIENTKVAGKIASNVANIHNILSFRMALGREADPDRSGTVYCGINLNMFARYRGQKEIPFMAQALAEMPRPVDHRLEVSFAAEALRSHGSKIGDPEALIVKALEEFPHFDDVDVKYLSYSTGGLYNCLGRYYLDTSLPKSKEYYENALELSFPLRLFDRQSIALSGLAIIERNLGNLSKGYFLASQAQHAAKLGANLIREATALRTSALCLQGMGHYSASITLYERALSLLPLCGMAGCDLEGGILSSWAEVHKLKTEYAEARAIQGKILKRSPLEENPNMHAFVLVNIAEIDVLMGTPAEVVQRSIDGAFAVYRAQKGGGSPMDVAACETMQADLLLREGDFTRAKALFDKNLKLVWGRYNELASLILEKVGDVRRWPRTNDNWTYAWPTLLLVQALKSNEKRAVYRALQFLGDVLHQDEDTKSAISLWTVALEGFTQLDVHCSRAECLSRLGDVPADCGVTELSRQAREVQQTQVEYA
ncbi:hypothetical protein C8F01DRAFT_1235791 [Mycena amicta]|nr:hypothetical protein C8F01DRAFT_1235791 [Mycena amicta]